MSRQRFLEVGGGNRDRVADLDLDGDDVRQDDAPFGVRERSGTA
jgi:hypothetical protein